MAQPTMGAGIQTDPNSAQSITVNVHQPYNLLIALDTLNSGDITQTAPTNGQLSLTGTYMIEAHYPLYLDDSKW
jgi:hypothetical protein